jgi:DNA-binding response OmpR family regulator
MTRTCKVLIVEDDADMRKLLDVVLEFEGFDAIIVRDGNEMRAVLAKETVDVVITDVSLRAAEDGYSIATYVKERGIAVILVTGHHDHFERLENSGHRYLLKPYPMASFIDVLGKAIDDAHVHCRAGDREYGLS